MSPRRCVVCGCKRNTNLFSSIKLYKFPDNEDKKKLWANAVKENWTPSRHSVICSRHFTTGKPSQEILHPDYLPTMLLCNDKQIEGASKQLKFKDSLQMSPMESDGAEESHPCDLCDKTFFDKNALELHYRKHTGELPHECSTCGKGFRMITSLRYHERSHLNPLHACPHCPFSTARSNYLNVHIASQHNNVYRFVCPVCRKGFSKRVSYVDHVKELHLISFKCDVLNVSFVSVLALKGYQKCSEQTDGKSHSDQCPFSTDYKGASEHPLLSVGKEVYECENCGKVCSHRHHLETHLLTCNNSQKFEKRPFHCSRCPYKTSLSERLMRHLLTHKEPLKCELCEKTFSMKYNLETHMMAHAGDRPYKCSFCGKGFCRIHPMQKHEETHTKVKKS